MKTEAVDKTFAETFLVQNSVQDRTPIELLKNITQAERRDHLVVIIGATISVMGSLIATTYTLLLCVGIVGQLKTTTDLSLFLGSVSMVPLGIVVIICGAKRFGKETPENEFLAALQELKGLGHLQLSDGCTMQLVEVDSWVTTRSNVEIQLSELGKLISDLEPFEPIHPTVKHRVTNPARKRFNDIHAKCLPFNLASEKGVYYPKKPTPASAKK